MQVCLAHSPVGFRGSSLPGGQERPPTSPRNPGADAYPSQHQPNFRRVLRRAVVALSHASSARAHARGWQPLPLRVVAKPLGLSSSHWLLSGGAVHDHSLGTNSYERRGAPAGGGRVHGADPNDVVLNAGRTTKWIVSKGPSTACIARRLPEAVASLIASGLITTSA